MDLVRSCSDLVRTLFGPRSEVFGPRSEVFKFCSEVLGSVQPAGLRECQLPNEANAGCYISSCGGGFFDADPGNAQHFKFPRSLTSVSLSSLFGHEISCTWALPMILRDYFCLQPASCLGCRKAAHDSKEL